MIYACCRVVLCVGERRCGRGERGTKEGRIIQLPSTVTQLSTSLADVKMADLEDRSEQKSISYTDLFRL